MAGQDQEAKEKRAKRLKKIFKNKPTAAETAFKAVAPVGQQAALGSVLGVPKSQTMVNPQEVVNQQKIGKGFDQSGTQPGQSNFVGPIQQSPAAGAGALTALMQNPAVMQAVLGGMTSMISGSLAAEAQRFKERQQGLAAGMSSLSSDTQRALEAALSGFGRALG